MIRIRNCTHVGISVPDVEEAVQFYERIVGLETSDRDNGAVFLRCNRDHHCLAIYPGDRALHHLGFEVAGEEALERAEHELAAQGFHPEPRDYPEPGHGSGPLLSRPGRKPDRALCGDANPGSTVGTA